MLVIRAAKILRDGKAGEEEDLALGRHGGRAGAPMPSAGVGWHGDHLSLASRLGVLSIVIRTVVLGSGRGGALPRLRASGRSPIVVRCRVHFIVQTWMNRRSYMRPPFQYRHLEIVALLPRAWRSSGRGKKKKKRSLSSSTGGRARWVSVDGLMPCCHLLSAWYMRRGKRRAPMIRLSP